MSKPRVLVDLMLGHRKMGFSGIPQDTRLLFDRLGESKSLVVDGLVYSNASDWHGGSLESLESQALYVGIHLDSPRAHALSRFMGRISGKLGHVVERLVIGNKSRYRLFPLRKEYSEVIWREFFSSTIESEKRSSIQDRDFVISNAGLWSFNDPAYFNLRASSLDTSGYDFVVFQDARKVRINTPTQKVIRYHDGLPVLATDTLRREHYTKVHVRSVKACERDSLFVCNSTSSRADLEILSPAAADRAVVIPYFVPTLAKLDCTRQNLEDIAHLRISQSTLPTERRAPRKESLIRKWFRSAEDNASLPRFLMTLSTIEPRKNIPALISAWQRLRETDPDLRLLIAGKPGWEYEQTLNAMRPFVEQGLILHVESVAQRELRYLYSAASCFVFPSFAEGFGLPPVEAMQCGCPVVVSDIPAHRYMAEDAALFFDPYNRQDIAEKISLALEPEKAAEMREKGFRNAERFTLDAVLPQWEAFFEKNMTRSKD